MKIEQQILQIIFVEFIWRPLPLDALRQLPHLASRSYAIALSSYTVRRPDCVKQSQY